MATRMLSVQVSAMVIALWAIDHWLNGGQYAQMFVKALSRLGIV